MRITQFQAIKKKRKLFFQSLQLHQCLFKAEITDFGFPLDHVEDIKTKPTKTKRATRNQNVKDAIGETSIFEIVERGCPDQVLATIRGVEITRRNLECVRGKEWFNATVIGAYLSLVEDYVDKAVVDKKIDGVPKMTCLDPSWFSQMLSYDETDATQDSTLLAGIGSKMYNGTSLLVPFNLNEAHWCVFECIVAKVSVVAKKGVVAKGCIVVYDTLRLPTVIKACIDGK